MRFKDVPSTLGSFHRSASQAESVISKSVATLLMAISLDLIGQNVLSSIQRVAIVIDESKAQGIEESRLSELQTLVKGIIDRSSHE